MLARLRDTIAAGCLAAGLGVPAAAADISGPAAIVDGDTLLVAGQTVHLGFIDAPEGGQLCVRENRRKWPCGQRAVDALKALVGDRPVTCRGEARDSNGWLVAVCASAEGRELNGLLVEAGLALAVRRDAEAYVAAERRARKAARGLWSGFFEAPSGYRARRWAEAGEIAPEPECPIKGNVDRAGARTYLMPHSRSYGWARIEPGRGERWFCSEAEAVAAGWRAPISD